MTFRSQQSPEGCCAGAWNARSSIRYSVFWARPRKKWTVDFP